MKRPSEMTNEELLKWATVYAADLFPNDPESPFIRELASRLEAALKENRELSFRVNAYEQEFNGQDLAEAYERALRASEENHLLKEGE